MTIDINDIALTKDDAWHSVDLDLLKKEYNVSVNVIKCPKCDGFGGYVARDYSDSDTEVLQCKRCAGAGLLRTVMLRFAEQYTESPYDAKVEIPKLMLKDS